MNCSEEHRRIILSWVEVAEDDLKVAHRESNLSTEERSERAICFHSQQSVEKLLKAFLICHGIAFPRTHNLIELQKLCAKIDESFLALDLSELNDYAVEVRYPDDLPAPFTEESNKAYELAKQVREFVMKRLKI